MDKLSFKPKGENLLQADKSRRHWLLRAPAVDLGELLDGMYRIEPKLGSDS